MTVRSQARLLELAERGRSSTVESAPAKPIEKPVALRCPRCRSAFDEIGARDPMPAQYDPERCSCGALLSFRYEDPTTPGRWIRRKVER